MNSFYFRKWFLLFELVALVTLLDELQMHSPLQFITVKLYERHHLPFAR